MTILNDQNYLYNIVVILDQNRKFHPIANSIYIKVVVVVVVDSSVRWSIDKVFFHFLRSDMAVNKSFQARPVSSSNGYLQILIILTH